MLQRAPEALDHDVISPAALAVHAQLSAELFSDERHEVAVGELAALVSVEDLGLAIERDRLAYGFDAEVRR